MQTIRETIRENINKIDHLDLDLIIAHVIKKPREFVLSHPEYKPTKAQMAKIEMFIQRRGKNEPLAYILGHKEFYGLDFKVTKDTLIPRPETELLVELAIQETGTKKQKVTIIDVGTGSGNIIISLAVNNKREPIDKFYALDISRKALSIARLNAKKHNAKIKFIESNLLQYFLDHCSLLNGHCIILANLPYLSKEIYNATLPNVKRYEPKSALYSLKEGLAHYEELLSQIKKIVASCELRVAGILEISPEQKKKLPKIIKTYLPDGKIEFTKDLAGKWRVCKIEI